VKHAMKSIAIGAALFTLGGIGCSDDPGPLGSIDSLIILQRTKRNVTGDIFQYTSYVPGARLVKLEPPTADGTLTTICCTGAEFARADISAKLADNQNYGLFLLQLADGSVTQIATDPQRDYVSPIFLPGDRVMFTSNAIVEAGAKQHVDEYERGVTIQLGRVNLDGTGMELGPRNLSHRTGPSLVADGRVIFTQWDHLGPENSGHLMFVNQDMQELREAFGKEGTGISNSVIKPREISPGRFIAIATARDRTIQAGALLDIRLGTVETRDGQVSAALNQSEKTATTRLLSPDVPTGNRRSADTVGRYYDAYPLNAKDRPDLLVSWADGPVEAGALAEAGESANFGIYLYDSARQQRRPILDDPEMWDIFAQPLRTRSAPAIVASASDPRLDGQTLIGSLNAYSSSLHTFQDGEIYGMRVLEGFSSEEGFPEMFGTTMFEGQANLGIARVQPDKSWAAKIPANIPIHIQAVDVFGMSLFNEPVWFSGRAGEARVCGGCHEPRTQTTNVGPGVLEAFVMGNNSLMGNVARAARLKTNPATPTEIVGVGWDTQVQPIFQRSCVSCHDGTSRIINGVEANPSYTITNPEDGTMVTWRFDLTGRPLPPEFAMAVDGATYSASYFSMAGPDMEAVERGDLMISGDFKRYLLPQNARGSIAIQKLNPTQLFPTPSTTRAFPGAGHLAEVVGPGTSLTGVEYYMLILAADMGVNYYARENNPMLNEY
jgi:hypothetical protein